MNPKIFLIFIIIIIIGVTADEIYHPHTVITTPVTVEIPQGFGSRRIAELLKNEKIIRSKWVFVAYASLKGEASYLKPGVYELDSVSIAEIVERLTLGGHTERAITIPEGWTAGAIAAHLEKQDIIIV